MMIPLLTPQPTKRNNPFLIHQPHADRGGGGSRDVHLENFSVSNGGRELIENANVMFAFGRRYGLVRGVRACACVCVVGADVAVEPWVCGVVARGGWPVDLKGASAPNEPASDSPHHRSLKPPNPHPSPPQIGRNGTGKTTFLRALASGEIKGLPPNCQVCRGGLSTAVCGEARLARSSWPHAAETLLRHPSSLHCHPARPPPLHSRCCTLSRRWWVMTPR